MMTPTEFRQTRIDLRLSQAELGDLLGLRQPQVCRLERGERPISRALALAMRALAEHPAEVVHK